MNISDGIKYHTSRLEFSAITLKSKSDTSNILKSGRNDSNPLWIFQKTSYIRLNILWMFY